MKSLKVNKQLLTEANRRHQQQQRSHGVIQALCLQRFCLREQSLCKRTSEWCVTQASRALVSVGYLRASIKMVLTGTHTHVHCPSKTAPCIQMPTSEEKASARAQERDAPAPTIYYRPLSVEELLRPRAPSGAALNAHWSSLLGLSDAEIACRVPPTPRRPFSWVEKRFVFGID